MTLKETLQNDAIEAPHFHVAYDNLRSALRERAKSGATKVTEDEDLWFIYAMDGQDTESWTERVFEEVLTRIQEEGVKMTRVDEEITFDWT